MSVRHGRSSSFVISWLTVSLIAAVSALSLSVASYSARDPKPATAPDSSVACPAPLVEKKTSPLRTSAKRISTFARANCFLVELRNPACPVVDRPNSVTEPNTRTSTPTRPPSAPLRCRSNSTLLRSGLSKTKKRFVATNWLERMSSACLPSGSPCASRSKERPYRVSFEKRPMAIFRLNRFATGRLAAFCASICASRLELPSCLTVGSPGTAQAVNSVTAPTANARTRSGLMFSIEVFKVRYLLLVSISTIA